MQVFDVSDVSLLEHQWQKGQAAALALAEADLAPDRHRSSRDLQDFVPQDEPSLCDGSEQNWHQASNPSARTGCSLTQFPARKEHPK